MSRASFIAAVAPVAVKVRIDGGPLFPSVSVAQTILETGGKIHPWNNIVGYKVGSGKQTPYWSGKAVRKGTWEVYGGRTVQTSADFRAYDSIEDCLKDQALLFLNNSRYRRVVVARTPEEQAAMLKECGYATDPQYAGKIMSIINSYGLKKYDEVARMELERIKRLENEVAELKKAIQSGPAPEWAESTIKKLAEKKTASGQPVMSDTNVSRDLARMLVILDRLGVIE